MRKLSTPTGLRIRLPETRRLSLGIVTGTARFIVASGEGAVVDNLIRSGPSRICREYLVEMQLMDELPIACTEPA